MDQPHVAPAGVHEVLQRRVGLMAAHVAPDLYAGVTVVQRRRPW
jgi:hypothetical protein